MTPAARYAAAITVLEAWLDGTPAEVALTRWARGARYAGSKDRAAVRDHVFDVLRCRGTCAALGGGTGARALVLGLLRHGGIHPDTVFTGLGHAPSPLEVKDRIADVPDVSPALDMPDWARQRIEARIGADAGALYKAMQARAPVFVRVNTRKATAEAVIAALAADGIGARTVPGCAMALEVTEAARRARTSAAFTQGWIEFQDLSVQRAVEAVDWPPEGRFLDYCAGGGGKSLAVAARSDLAIDAFDANPNRMSDLPERARRAGARIRIILKDQAFGQAPYDVVLCDVPCSGSGTWRRDPETKWRMKADDLQGLTALQAQILGEVAGLVSARGQLVYMTCSFFAEENEQQVQAFCAGHPGWEIDWTRSDTPLTASDGFFTAVLRKTG